MTYEENLEFFNKHIEEYNISEEYYTHYVLYKGNIMVITWGKLKWDFIIVPLEEFPSKKEVGP